MNFELLTDSLSKIDPFSYAALGVLFAMSVYSWAVIAQKLITMKSIEKNTLNYVKDALKRVDLGYILNSPNNQDVRDLKMPAQRILAFCVAELAKLKNPNLTPKTSFNTSDINQLLNRVSDAAISSFVIESEKKLGVLASIGATAPFVGLFGTVTGVVSTLYGINSDSGQVQFAVVAPGLSVALVATAFGLFVAIPAVLYFNYFRSKIRFLNLTINEFKLKLVNQLITLA